MVASSEKVNQYEKKCLKMALNEKDTTKACFLTYLIMSVNEESLF